MSENLTKRVAPSGTLTFATRAARQSVNFGTAIATLPIFPPLNYRGMQAVSAKHPPPGDTPLSPSNIFDPAPAPPVKSALASPGMKAIWTDRRPQPLPINEAPCSS